MYKRFLLVAGLMIFASATFLVARGFRAPQIPNGTLKSCANCHVNPGGGGPRNPFGQEIEANHLSTPGSAGQVEWNEALAQLDSDGDGFTNGEELQDPDGTWRIGQPFPGDPALVTNPGDATDFPNTTTVEQLPGTATTHRLGDNYPNPFNPSTTIRFELSQAAMVRLEIYDAAGTLLRVLVDEHKEAGIYASTWNGRDTAGQPLASGSYFYRLSANSFSSTKRMVLLK